jgi:transcriptional regulator with XRE-family HTH domain
MTDNMKIEYFNIEQFREDLLVKRHKAKLSRYALERITGVHNRTIKDIEHGARDKGSHKIETVMRVCNWLGKTVDNYNLMKQ